MRLYPGRLNNKRQLLTREDRQAVGPLRRIAAPSPGLFLVMPVNGGHAFQVKGNSLKAVRRRFGLRYLVQQIPSDNKKEVSVNG